MRTYFVRPLRMTDLRVFQTWHSPLNIPVTTLSLSITVEKYTVIVTHYHHCLLTWRVSFVSSTVIGTQKLTLLTWVRVETLSASGGHLIEIHQLGQDLCHLPLRMSVFWKWLIQGTDQWSIKAMYFLEIGKLSRSEDTPNHTHIHTWSHGCVMTCLYLIWFMFLN